MTSLIKNQIVKHLSKFARNIKPEQINLEILSGRSELTNIELNEEVLASILELPRWLRISRAHCNRVSVKVPWTSLKSKPIQIIVDEISVEVLLTSDQSGQNVVNPFGTLAASSSYGFADKVVDGMSLYVNTVEVQFASELFGGSLMLSRLVVESRTPSWNQAPDLKYTRVMCPESKKMLLYKHISWQLLRVEASANSEERQKRNINAPLRLITSGGTVRVTVKKDTNDGSFLCGKLECMLGDILWVATLPQLRSALVFASYINGLIKAAQTSRIPTASPSKPFVKQQQLTPASVNHAPSPITLVFRKRDISQTSLHLFFSKIDLHLCDDGASAGSHPPNWDIESGALQVTLNGVYVDAFPDLDAFRPRPDIRRANSANADGGNTVFDWMQRQLEKDSARLADSLDEKLLARVQRCWPQLRLRSLVVRLTDLNVLCVSDIKTKKEELRSLLVSDRRLLSLPSGQPAVELEFADYFHAASSDLPVPSSATHIQAGPLAARFDARSIRWAAFVAHQLESVLADLGAESGDLPPVNVKLKLLSPKLIVDLAVPPSEETETRLPTRLVASICSVEATNAFDKTPTEPSAAAAAADPPETDLELEKIVETSEQTEKPLVLDLLNKLKDGANIPSINRGDQWWIETSPMWVETDRGEYSRPFSLIADTSLKASVALREAENVQTLVGYVSPSRAVHAFVDHFQLLQLTRLIGSVSKFADQLADDEAFYEKLGDGTAKSPVSVALLLALQEINVHLLLPCGAMPSPYSLSGRFFEPPLSVDFRNPEDEEMERFNSDLNIVTAKHALTTKSISGTSTPVKSTTRTLTPSVVATTSDAGTDQAAASDFPLGLSIPHAASASSGLGASLAIGSHIDSEVASIADSHVTDDEQTAAFLDLEVEEATEAQSEDDPSKPQSQQGKAGGGKLADEEDEARHRQAMAMPTNELALRLGDLRTLVSKQKTRTTVVGRAARLDVAERLGRPRSAVYRPSVEQSPAKTAAPQEATAASSVRFQLAPVDQTRNSHLKIDASALDISLDDEVVSHLGPFVEDPLSPANTMRLEVNVEQSTVEIRNAKKKKPLRIWVERCVIEQDED